MVRRRAAPRSPLAPLPVAEADPEPELDEPDSVVLDMRDPVEPAALRATEQEDAAKLMTLLAAGAPPHASFEQSRTPKPKAS